MEWKDFSIEIETMSEMVSDLMMESLSVPNNLSAPERLQRYQWLARVPSFGKENDQSRVQGR